MLNFCVCGDKISAGPEFVKIDAPVKNYASAKYPSTPMSRLPY
jgi:hypothetical protein